MNVRPSLSNCLRVAAAGLTAALLSACGGHSGSGSLPSTPNGKSGTATVKFHIVVPAKAKTASSVRRPNYVSVSTHTATVAVAPAAGGTTTTATLTCTATCDGSVSAPLGSDTFTVSLLSDGTEISPTSPVPQLLSTGTKTQTIQAGSANVVNLTFNPVVASVTFTPATFTLGAAGDGALTVLAQDAAGNDIVGTNIGTFIDASGNAVAFSATIAPDTAGAGAVTVVTPGSTVVKPGDTIAVHYNGQTPFFSGKVTPSVVSGAVTNLYASSDATVGIAGTAFLASSIAAGSPEGIALDPLTPATKLWYAANAGGINSFAGGVSSPVGTAPYPIYVAADANNLWFTDWGANGINPSPAAIYRVAASDNTVTSFPLPATPVDYSFGAPEGVIHDAGNDAVWFSVRGWGNGGTLPAGTIQSAIGKLSPLSSDTPAFTFYPVPGNPYGLTLGPGGKIWYAEDWGNKVGVLDPTLATTQTPVEYSLGDGQPFADAAEGITFDTGDNSVWVARQSSDQVAQVTAGGTPTYYKLPAGSQAKNIIYVADFAGTGTPRLIFTESNTGKIGILDPAKATPVQPPTYNAPVTAGLTELQLPAGIFPVGLAWSGTALWVTDNGQAGGTGHILQITGF
jgi:streptogramin lyase